MKPLDRLGTLREQPVMEIERDSSISFMRLIYEPDLNFDNTEDCNRPPALLFNRG